MVLVISSRDGFIATAFEGFEQLEHLCYLAR